MCGIFGLALSQDSNLTFQELKDFTQTLFKLSYSRGKEAAGLAIDYDNQINLLTKSLKAPAFIASNEFKTLFSRFGPPSTVPAKPLSLIGHTRLVTHGAGGIDNQPIVKNGLVGVHNGICVNVKELWQENRELSRHYNVDSEIILSLIDKYYRELNSLGPALQKTFAAIQGAASIGVLFDKFNSLLLATNNGSLYYLNYTDGPRHFFVFASESTILQKFLDSHHLQSQKIIHLEPVTAALIDTPNLAVINFPLQGPLATDISSHRLSSTKKITDFSKVNRQAVSGKYFDDLEASPELVKLYLKTYQNNLRRTANLRRCTNCILPSTMPFIEFDHQGLCNYCRQYKKIQLKSKTQLDRIIAPIKTKGKQPNCLVMFSGGRDSSYALHYVKRQLKLNPVAYSYDWGMLTDLGRRNQARMCGTLGVEHILLSADIKKKRNNIKKNILAWLHKPDLGTVPLFMAGDKQYLYYAEKIRRELGLPLIIFGANPLEITGFKVAFCGIKPRTQNERSVNINLMNKLQLSWYYLKKFFTNPGYLNSSLFDTLHGFLTYYLVSHHNLYLFDYINWDEDEIDHTLKQEYNWEFARDSQSSWRIGDGTASFYNYIYLTLAGFSENDTFRSNQIREGIISRDKALALAQRDNYPRFDSIYWYTKTIGLDFADTLNKINSAKKLY